MGPPPNDGTQEEQPDDQRYGAWPPIRPARKGGNHAQQEPDHLNGAKKHACGEDRTIGRIHDVRTLAQMPTPQPASATSAPAAAISLDVPAVVIPATACSRT